MFLNFSFHKKTFIILFLGIGLSSCSFKELDLKSTDNFNVEQFSKDGIIVGVDATIYNPNSYAIKIKDIQLDIYVKNDFVATTKLAKTVKIKARETKPYHFSIVSKEGSLNKKVLPKLLFMATSNSSNPLTFKGFVKGNVFIFSKKIPVEFKDKIDLN